MKYIEVVKAVREEQMKKEASVKELAGLLKKKAAGTFYGPVQPYLPGTKLNEPVPKGAGKPYLHALSRRVAETKPAQMLGAYAKQLATNAPADPLTTAAQTAGNWVLNHVRKNPGAWLSGAIPGAASGIPELMKSR